MLIMYLDVTRRSTMRCTCQEIAAKVRKHRTREQDNTRLTLNEQGRIVPTQVTELCFRVQVTGPRIRSFDWNSLLLDFNFHDRRRRYRNQTSACLLWAKFTHSLDYCTCLAFAGLYAEFLLLCLDSIQTCPYYVTFRSDCPGRISIPIIC
ncbi:hypothetical protein CPB85DRAFT_861786 [Mucidula mucida]|nr:hypothetical protein CPB85DRAFT_861786 [Mucidula mucida]